MNSYYMSIDLDVGILTARKRKRLIRQLQTQENHGGNINPIDCKESCIPLDIECPLKRVKGGIYNESINVIYQQIPHADHRL